MYMTLPSQMTYVGVSNWKPCGRRRSIRLWMVADSAAVRVRLAVSAGLQVPGRLRRHAAAGNARVSKARWKGPALLGHRSAVQPRRHRLAVLEPDGLYAGGTAR